MICRVGGVDIEMGGEGNTFHTSQTDSKCSHIHDRQFNQWFALPGPIEGSPVTTPTILATGVDYSAGAPGGAALAAAGYSFACRYVTDGAPQLPHKLLTAAEAHDLWAHGVDIVSNWESSGTSCLGGYRQGVADATIANANHLAAGGPPDRPIYFSVDYDAPDSDQDAINAYLQGVESVIGRSRAGVYGGYWVVTRCLDAGVAAWAWQTDAWSGDPAGLAPAGMDGDYLDRRANLLQRNVLGCVSVNGVQCDVDAALTADFGQWHYMGADVTNPAYPTPAYEQLAGPIGSDGYGHGWPELGQNKAGQNLTPVDALAWFIRQVCGDVAVNGAPATGGVVDNVAQLLSAVAKLQSTVDTIAARVAQLKSPVDNRADAG